MNYHHDGNDDVKKETPIVSLSIGGQATMRFAYSSAHISRRPTRVIEGRVKLKTAKVDAGGMRAKVPTGAEVNTPFYRWHIENRRLRG